MATALAHRGPDSFGYIQEPQFGMGCHRLSVVDLAGGSQPMFSDDRSIIMVCNGEIFNYRALRADLQARGYRFRSECDVEVLIPLYQERGIEFLDEINGQFSLILYDRNKDMVVASRDHVGITPLFYTISDGRLLLASEIKALLQSGLVDRTVNLIGLDQVLSLPGLVSPVTMFKGIHSLPGGNRLIVKGDSLIAEEYWDLDYPEASSPYSSLRVGEYVDQLDELLTKAVDRRLQGDVSVGLYLSGGLDSSLIGALACKLSPGLPRHSFSVAFTERSFDESQFQRRVARHINSVHHEVIADAPKIADHLRSVIYHCECPIKETYNSCSMLLAETAKTNGVKVVLSGEGADELFGGYIGYRLDGAGLRRRAFGDELYDLMEKQISERVWGDADFYYERDFQQIDEVRKAIYSERVLECLRENGCFGEALVNRKRLVGRSRFHRRSYLDLKLRLSDHLLADHGDRMAMARGVEVRYPFLDRNLIDWVRAIPSDILLNEHSDKYLIRQVARRFLPEEIALRSKFAFHAPGSSQILRLHKEWLNDLLSYERINRQGYFDPTAIEKLRNAFMSEDFRLNVPFENDLLTIVITFGIFLDTFKLPNLA